MSGVAELHERLLAIEDQARDVVTLAFDTDAEVPAPLAFALAALSDTLKRIDETRVAVQAREKLEGRWS